MQTEASAPWIRATILAAFVAFSCWVVVTDPMGLIPLLRAPWGTQVGLDLCLSLSIAWSLIARDPRYRGERLWPWMLATVALGSIAPLAFMVLRAVRAWLRHDQEPVGVTR